MRKRALLFIPILWMGISTIEPRSVLIYADSAKVWVNHHFEFEKVLRMGSIVSVEDLGEGRNKPKKVRLKLEDLAVKAIWKPIERGRHEWAWECYQAEVVAYRMDKLLGLNMVPPTVERNIGGRAGSLQLWVDGAKLCSEVHDRPQDPDKWDRELARMKLFDNLICNPDRHPGNYMVDSDWNIILIDHSQCFLSRQELNENPENVPSRFDRKLAKELRNLRFERLQVRFARLLMDREIEAIMARRDALLTHMEKLIAERGEDAVIY